MQVISVNISQERTIRWRGRDVPTGIYKIPVEGSITIRSTGVENDCVSDRKFHGGPDMAFYAFSVDHYPDWQKRYKSLHFDYGMFGENLTIGGMKETDIGVGDTFRLGGGLVQAIQPRQPCYKLGVKFGTQTVLKDFIDAGQSGVYFRVLEPCLVNKGLELVPETINSEAPSIQDVYRLLYFDSRDQALIGAVLNNRHLPQGVKEAIAKRQKQS